MLLWCTKQTTAIINVIVTLSKGQVDENNLHMRGKNEYMKNCSEYDNERSADHKW